MLVQISSTEKVMIEEKRGTKASTQITYEARLSSEVDREVGEFKHDLMK